MPRSRYGGHWQPSKKLTGDEARHPCGQADQDAHRRCRPPHDVAVNNGAQHDDGDDQNVPVDSRDRDLVYPGIGDAACVDDIALPILEDDGARDGVVETIRTICKSSISIPD